MFSKSKVILGVVIVTLMASCVASNSPNAQGPDNPKTNEEMATAGGEVDVTQANLSLADYLRRVPGVKVLGSGSSTRVLVRSSTSISGTTEPLYVIDNVPIGNNYSRIESMVSVNDIENVRVLKSGGEAAAYGTRGSNGVILIRTKKKK